MTASLTAARLRELLDYNPRTGRFTWRVDKTGRGARKGATAGTVTKRYRIICIDLKRYNASRLAFLWMTNRWPKFQADHINLDTTDDRWRNLRDATPSQNTANCKTKNKFGLKGVKQVGQRYAARISIDSRTIHLGTFGTPKAAHAAYIVAAKRYFGDFARSA
jgi:hypothetical protein